MTDQPNLETSDEPTPVKPKLRGVLHLIGAVIAIPFCVALDSASAEQFRVASLIYSASLISLLSTSALYHVPHWSPARRAFMRRLDHAMIFVLIGGSYVPFLWALGERSPSLYISIYIYLVGIGTSVGIIRSLFIQAKSKILRVFSYGALGVVGVGVVPSIYQHLGLLPASLILAGGVVYGLGTAAYALKRPNIYPAVFEYHELFHLCVNIAAALHFTAIWSVVTA